MHRGLATFAGVTILAACACGASAGLASLGGVAGVVGPSGIYYVGILSLGGLLFAFGVTREPRAWLPAALFLGALATAGLLAPPRVMSDSVAHQGTHVIGFLLYLGALAALIWTLLRLYSASPNWPTILGMGSVALAIGCTCCLTPGAIRYTALWAGLEPSWLVSRFALVTVGTLLGSYAFYKADRQDWLRYYYAGVLVVYPVEKLAELIVPTWQVGSASLTFLIRYPLFLTGTGLIVFAASKLLVEQQVVDSEKSIGEMPATGAIPQV